MKPRVAGMVYLSRLETDPKLIEHLRKELTIIPRKPKGYGGEDVKPVPIRCYVETSAEFGVPRSYWFSSARRDYDYEWATSLGQATDFPSKLRHEGTHAEQALVIQSFLDRYELVNDDIPEGLHLGGIFQADTGFGKCLGLGTHVLMFDGITKPVEEVREGELVMGPDSIPRVVGGVTRGRGPLYRVVPKKGDPWVCNDVHVLTLVETVSGETVDIPLNEYLLKSKKWKHRHKLFQPDTVDFGGGDHVLVDPYFVGVWIGDGTKNLGQGVRVTTMDPEIRACLEEQAVTWDAKVKLTHQADRCPTYRIVTPMGAPNGLLTAMREVFPDGPKLPHAYLTASRRVRMEVLAGIVDTDGHLATRGSTIDIVQKDTQIAADITFLARSLGFRVTQREKWVGGSRYERLLVSGDTDQIPVRIPRKMAAPRRQKKNHRRVGFRVEPLGVGEYAGFSLDGDGRFLLGDFTVTHNTNTALGLIHRLGRTALILVHKEFLLKQWVRRIKQFMPEAKVGLVQGTKCEIEGKDIVLGMMQSLALEDGNRYPPELYTWPGILVIDECFIGSQQVASVGGLKRIDEVAVGDRVMNAVGEGTVTAVSQQWVDVDDLRLVSIGSSQVVCTKDHPFLTTRGWVDAGLLDEGDMVLTHRGCIDTVMVYGQASDAESVSAVREASLGEKREEVLFEGMHGPLEEGDPARVRTLWRDGQEIPVSFLFSVLSAELDAGAEGFSGVETGAVRANAGVAQGSAGDSGGGVAEDGREQPDAASRGASEAVFHPEEDRAQAEGERWERLGSDEAAGDSLEVPGGRLGARESGGHREEEPLAVPLQDRPGSCGLNDRSGSRRGVSRIPEEAGVRQEEGCLPSFLRVEGVEVPKREDLDRLGARRVGDRVSVHNLSVGGHPSYTLDSGAVVHNCHRVGAQTWAPIPAQFNAHYRLGLTATPRRKDGADKVFWWHLGKIVYRAEKVMPKPHVRIVQVPAGENAPAILRRPNTSPAIILNVLTKLTKRNHRIVRECVKILNAPSGRKVMILSERLEHLRTLSTMLKSELGAGWDDVPIGYYVGEWFTGEKTPALKKGQWKMDEEGRKAAILTIYRSLSRRRLKDAEGNKLQAGAILVDEETKEKTHMVVLRGATVNAIRGLTDLGSVTLGEAGFHPDADAVPVILQTLTDPELFQLAREFKIKQKAVEKKKIRTDEELFEAEQARVIFASYQMCAEGVDLPAVDTEILASPVSDAEQAVGRARRECLPEPSKCAHFCPWRAGKCKGKPNPIVADIADVGVPLATRRRRYREEFYADSGFKVASGS